jgi:hypothetical protein
MIKQQRAMSNKSVWQRWSGQRTQQPTIDWSSKGWLQLANGDERAWLLSCDDAP